jgi:hypothetical protein
MENTQALKLVWVYDDGNEIKCFGNRKDAMLFAYHTIAKELDVYDAERPSPDTEYLRIVLNLDSLPGTSIECANMLREQSAKSGKNRRYLFDDHLGNTDRWGDSSRRPYDMDVRVGEIDISVHDEHSIWRWDNCVGVDLEQYPVVDTDECPLTIIETVNLLGELTIHSGGHIVDPSKGIEQFAEIAEKITSENNRTVERSKMIRVEDVSPGTIIYRVKGEKFFTLQPPLKNYTSETVIGYP